MPKPKGACCEYTDERDAFLLSSYLRLIAGCSIIRMRDVMRRLVCLPAPRFWCSEYQAAMAIKERIKGRMHKVGQYPNRKRMYDQIYDRFLVIRQKRPKDRIIDIAFDIVNSPAPESFLTPESAEILLNRHRIKLRKGKRMNLPQAASSSLKTASTLKRNEKPISDNKPADDCVVLLAADTGCDVDVTFQRVSDLDSSIVPDDSCQHPAPDCQHDLPADAGIHHQRQCKAVRNCDIDIHDNTRRYNRRYTNVRYISAQLRIDWFSSNE